MFNWFKGRIINGNEGECAGLYPRRAPEGAPINQNKPFHARISESYLYLDILENENLLEPPAKPDSWPQTSH